MSESNKAGAKRALKYTNLVTSAFRKYAPGLPEYEYEMFSVIMHSFLASFGEELVPSDALACFNKADQYLSAVLQEKYPNLDEKSMEAKIKKFLIAQRAKNGNSFKAVKNRRKPAQNTSYAALVGHFN